MIPPGAPLAPSSTISPGQAGKAPGRKLPNGLWVGYDWRRAPAPSEGQLQHWLLEGANIGLRASRFPAVDIDTTDPELAAIVEGVALSTLGKAPVRIGKAPKRLLMYRTDEPFSRMRAWVTKGGVEHLIEVLGDGQQYLIHGIHPATMQPYQWVTDVSTLAAEDLTRITREDVARFYAELVEALGMITASPVTFSREGDGRVKERTTSDQSILVAPSIEVLASAVAMIPNTDALFPGRDEYIRLGYAIRAASGEEVDEGFAIFADWAGRHEADGRVAGNPETWLDDWRRMKGPYALGWRWIAEQARGFGFNDAQYDFVADLDDRSALPPEVPNDEAPRFSDQWLADRCTSALRSQLRYVPERERWIAWDGYRWQPDAILLAEDLVKRELRPIAVRAEQEGATDREKARSMATAVAICSAGTASRVRSLMQSDRTIAISASALDHDPWLLSTPAGLVDLTTGALGPPSPDALCTRATSVAPAFGAAPHHWLRFLDEATGGDTELQAYLQRLAGYCLTGSVKEHHFTFVWGPGGNGKGTFLHAISDILGDYAREAPMDTFTSSHHERHTTEIAMLSGARLVTASETQAGKRWDEQKLKAMTGGDRVTARFMRQDNFTFRPTFKLVFSGNHKPEIRDLDDAMRRRTHLVPFTVTPSVIDRELDDKLRAEYPAILAWMIEGCLAWQQRTLAPPAIVADATQDYFEEQDAVGRWLAERCTLAPGAGPTMAGDLWNDWQEWANANGEYVGSQKRLSSSLIGRALRKWRDPKFRRNGFEGIELLPRALGLVA